jgi:threonine synthase
MPISSHLRCIKCPFCVTLESGHLRCARQGCGGLLEVAHNLDVVAGTAEEWKQIFRQRRMSDKPEDASGVWRFREFVLPHLDTLKLVTRGGAEGNTPLLRFRGCNEYAGCVDVAFKHEGYNGTGSFKDRGMTAGVSAAVHGGAKMLACASTGNTAASMASYAALAGLPALILLPDGAVAMGKIAQSLAYGAKVVMVRGNFDDALALVAKAGQQFGLSIMNSLNPLRLEGQKTIIWEMLEQRGWQAPDWIVVPGGNLGNAAAFHKALVEARQLGWITKMPKLAIIQAKGANPLESAWRDFLTWRGSPSGVLQQRKDPTLAMRTVVHEERLHPVEHPETVATAIRIGAPVNFPKAMRALHDTDGECISVTDDEILEAKIALDRCGIGAEPSSATVLAGLRELRRQNLVDPAASVVCVLTGHVLKDVDAIAESMHRENARTRLPNEPITIDPSLEELREVLEE